VSHGETQCWRADRTATEKPPIVHSSLYLPARVPRKITFQRGLQRRLLHRRDGAKERVGKVPPDHGADRRSPRNLGVPVSAAGRLSVLKSVVAQRR
jgi:hypothetical protein